MIGTALYEVSYPDETYQHVHYWMSDGPQSALLELSEWERETRDEQHCTLKLLNMRLQERTDIGY